MSQVAAIAVTAILSASVATGVNLYMQQPAPEYGTDSEESAELRALRQEIGQLRQQVEAHKPQVSRAPVETVSQADIAAAVAAYMKSQQPVEAAATRQPGKLLAPAQAFQQLRGTDMDDKDAEALWARYREAGKEMELLELFKEHAANNPQDADAQSELGTAYLQALQGKPPGPETGHLANEADKSFDAALKLNPEHWEARFTKAMALTFWPPVMGKTPIAIDNFETLIKQQESAAVRKPHFAQTYLMLGNMYSQQGKAELAKQTWQKGASLFPGNSSLSDKLK